MHWFHVIFSREEMRLKLHLEFFEKLKELVGKDRNPEHLKIYELQLRFCGDPDVVFYLSVPDELSYEVKNVLAGFNSHIINKPNLSLLKAVDF